MAELCCTALAAERAPLKNELQSELQNAGIVRCIGLQETIGAQGVSKAADGAYAAGRSGAAPQIAELRVVKNVEGFGAELQSNALVNGKALEHGHVEVGGVRIGEPISAHIAESQTPRLHEDIRVVLEWTKSRARRRIGN